jgi:hypothetical protein
MKGVPVKKIYILISLMIILLFLCTSCTYHMYHFGVANRAAMVPDDFGETEAAIAQAEQSEGANYCPDKIAKAKELAHDGAETYWAGHNTESSRLLAEARLMAQEAEGCGPKAAAAPPPPPLPLVPPDATEPIVLKPMPAPAPVPVINIYKPVPKPKSESAIHKIDKSSKYNEYKVELAADTIMKIPGPPGRLRVWIGNPNYEANFPDQMKQATGTLPAVGVTAMISPYAPAFTVEPKESKCMRIHPTGSEIGFTLTPKGTGTFDVGADVKLYETDDCSGSPVPKATTTLKVKVEVDKTASKEEIEKKFWDVFWEKLLDFWGGILTLFFALLLFLLRRHIKKWFGFGGDK